MPPGLGRQSLNARAIRAISKRKSQACGSACGSPRVQGLKARPVRAVGGGRCSRVEQRGSGLRHAQQQRSQVALALAALAQRAGQRDRLQGNAEEAAHVVIENIEHPQAIAVEVYSSSAYA